jgi:hypothetical protein
MCQLCPTSVAKHLGDRTFFIEKHSTNTDTHIRMSIHPHEYMHAHSILMSISERLSRLNLKIHKVSHQERLVVDGDAAFH